MPAVPVLLIATEEELIKHNLKDLFHFFPPPANNLTPPFHFAINQMP